MFIFDDRDYIDISASRLNTFCTRISTHLHSAPPCIMALNLDPKQGLCKQPGLQGTVRQLMAQVTVSVLPGAV